MGSVAVRWMLRRDMPEIMEIENGSWDVPESEDDIIKALREKNCIGMVAEEGDKVVGYVVYTLHKIRMEIMHFAVHPDRRREGIGTVIVERLQGKLSPHRRTGLFVNVSEWNMEGQLFLRDVGFRAVTVLRGHYEDGDAYRMSLSVPVATA